MVTSYAVIVRLLWLVSILSKASQIYTQIGHASYFQVIERSRIIYGLSSTYLLVQKNKTIFTSIPIATSYVGGASLTCKILASDCKFLRARDEHDDEV